MIRPARRRRRRMPAVIGRIDADFRPRVIGKYNRQGATRANRWGQRMFAKRDGARILFCSSRQDVRLELDGAEFADVSSACASLDETTVVLTAAREKSDVADVNANRKGDYRAYRLSAGGLEQLTDEYTNSAIPLGHEGLAYSNGKGLVVIKKDRRIEHKVGRFNWGPPSISTNEDGSLLAMVKWKGDDRKLLICETDSQRAQISRFSLYSYVLAGRAVYYELHREVRSFLPETSETSTVTNAAFKRSFLKLCDLTQFAPADLQFGFSSLSILNGLPIVNVQIADPHSFESHADVIVSIGSDGNPAAILMAAPKDADWRIQAIKSIGHAARARMGRFERVNNFPELKETRFVWIGDSPAGFVDNGWTIVASPRVADFGFQFLPSAAVH